jgi:signal transduction histidine kinase
LQCADYKDFISIKSYTELHAKLGALYFKQGKWHEAENAFMSSFTQADKYQLRDLKKESALSLSEIYAKLNDFSKAYQYGNIASQLRDSLYNEAQSKGITELQFKYDSEKSEKEIQTLKLRQTEFLLIFGGILLLTVIAVSFYVIRLRGRNNKSLQIKNIQIEEQNMLLLEKNAALEQFAYAAAHDLKEPLRNIGSFANLLQRRYKEQFDNSAQEYMNFIVTGAKRMNDLLVGLLNFSALTNQKAANEDVYLSEIIDVVKANLRTAIEEKQAIVQCENILPSLRIHHLHLVQLFQNLISNALKFNDGKPIINISAKNLEKETLLILSDNGIGMDKAYESKVFRLFHRLDKNKNYEGSGVGLSICKNIVEKYGGRIWYESEIGKGTTFFIAIPKQQMAMAA